MKSFEDLGFYCLDNLPPALVPELVTLAERAGIERIALSLDVRVQGAFGEASAALDELGERGVQAEVLFLEASDDAIVRRYSETRRRHPRDGGGSLPGAIACERTALEAFRARATHVWDTSQFTHTLLKDRIAATYGTNDGTERLAVRVVAFGFKFGVPLDADLVFDVRFFSNPNYVEHLKPLTGLDEPVAAFMDALPDVAPFSAQLFGFIDFLIPRYRREGKTRLTIAIGCTGGRHRSVFIAQRLAAHLAALDGISVTTELRELVAV
jgi:UPF0042 nucleotide-binding protein